MEEEKLNELGILRRKYEIHVIDLAKIIGCSPQLLMKYEIGYTIKDKKYLDNINKILENPKQLYYLNKEDKIINNINEFDILRINQIILLLINKKEYTLKLYKMIEISNIIGKYITNKSIIGIIDYENKINDIINNLCNYYILKRNIIYKKDNSVLDITYKIKDIDYDYLDDQQVLIINKVYNYFKDYSLNDIMNFKLNKINYKKIVN